MEKPNVSVQSRTIEPAINTNEPAIREFQTAYVVARRALPLLD
ncbi:MAG TPA: hypothetical protein ACFYEF_09665 [Candidatus Wunengus sp. YC63]